jgi:glycosyltransferase involved in cell wall biosynthesis
VNWNRVLEQATARFVDRFVVSNRAAVSALADRYHISPSRVAVIPGGVDIERYDPSRPRTGAWRTQLGIPTGAIVLGTIGRLVPQKGFRELVRAFASIDKRDVWLVICGDGPEWEDLHGLVEAFDLKDRVRFPGSVDAVPDLLADLDIFVLPSLRESHPTVLLEAMAMARPVIASDIAAVNDAIADGIEGKLAAAGDVPALAEAIGAFLSDATTARRCGRNARRKVEQEYTVERMVRRSAVLYEELLTGSR